MIQITGLTKIYRRGRPPALLDLTFEARPGMVTALLGSEDAGKTTALRLMLELERGQGVALFDGRRYRSLRRPEREVGVLLTTARTVAGHPGRTARSHLRMLAAAAGVPARRADELLEQTRLATVAGYRLRTFSPGMNRRLALAAALLGDPDTLLLDAPTEGLSPRNVEWFHSFLRSFAVAGGTVLLTGRSGEEAARTADRVITLEQGRLVADQPTGEFRSSRMRSEVAVRGPQMARLADLLTAQGAEVRREGAVGIAVAGVGRTEIGELAYRHGILLHELADRVAERPVVRPALPVSSGRSGHVQVQQAKPAHPVQRTQQHPLTHQPPSSQSSQSPQQSQQPQPVQQRQQPPVVPHLRRSPEPAYALRSVGTAASEGHVPADRAAPEPPAPARLDPPAPAYAAHAAPLPDPAWPTGPVGHESPSAAHPAPLSGPDHRSE